VGTAATELASLPAAPNALLGRERQVKELSELLLRDDVRLLVLASEAARSDAQPGIVHAPRATVTPAVQLTVDVALIDAAKSVHVPGRILFETMEYIRSCPRL
jgi:hypothetical protein